MFMLNLVRQQIRRLPKGARAILLTCIYGVVAGLATVAFQVSMNVLFEVGVMSFSKASLWEFALGSLGMILGTSLVAGWLLGRFCPEAAGSGIPQLKMAFWKEFGNMPFRVIWVKFLAGVLSIGGGASMGREGPSVHLAGAVGSNLAALLGEAKQKRRDSAASGAAAGLAAAFNTPLASVTFVLEEIIGDLNSRFLGGVLLASVLGALMVHGLISDQPAFALHVAGDPTYQAYALTPLVALLASLVGVQFQQSCLGLRARARRWKGGNSWALPAVGAFITWALGVAVFIATTHRAEPGTFPKYSIGEIHNVSSLARKLKRTSDPVSVYLMEEFSVRTRAAVLGYPGSGMDNETLEQLLVTELNANIVGGWMYERNRFGNVTLRPESRDLLDLMPQGQELARLNRLLLEDTYSLELRRPEGSLGVFALGYHDLSAALDGRLFWKVALLLLLAKFVATVACYGTGGCGGIFSPTLFFGGMVGLAVSGALTQAGDLLRVDLGLMPQDVMTLVVVGMSACLGAVVWAPVTGVLIVFEMTHQFSLVPPLMLGALVSSWIGRRFNSRNFYEAILEQDGHEIDHVRPPRDLTEWQQLPVSAIANFKPAILRDSTPEAMGELLRKYPYDRFPWVSERELKGVLTRDEIERARQAGDALRPNPVSTCLPKDSIRRLQRLLIDSPEGLVLLTDRPGGKVIGIVTLHDLLRAQTQVAAAQED